MTAKEIAEGLTEAQRELMLSLSGAWKFCTVDEVRGLNGLGLTAGRKFTYGYAARLTPLGLSVRSELEKQTRMEGDPQ